MSHLEVNFYHRQHEAISSRHELHAAVALDNPRQKSKVSSPDVEVFVDLHPPRPERKSTFCVGAKSVILLKCLQLSNMCTLKEPSKRHEIIVQRVY